MDRAGLVLFVKLCNFCFVLCLTIILFPVLFLQQIEVLFDEIKICLVSFFTVKIGPSFTDTAMGRIAQGTKLLTEGGYENVFRRTFETIPGEKLQKAYACYLSTSAGPVIGTLYLSTVKLSFCSDSPLAYYPHPGQTEWSYYKV
jgi:hypothetical protein